MDVIPVIPVARSICQDSNCLSIGCKQVATSSIVVSVDDDSTRWAGEDVISTQIGVPSTAVWVGARSRGSRLSSVVKYAPTWVEGCLPLEALVELVMSQREARTCRRSSKHAPIACSDLRRTKRRVDDNVRSFQEEVDGVVVHSLHPVGVPNAVAP